MKRHALLFIGIISAFTLLFALIRQYGFGDSPCYLCFFERIPYGLAAIIGIGVGGFYAVYRPGVIPFLFLKIMLVIFVISAGLAFYHIGVEQKWFPLLEACQGALPSSENFEEFFATLQATSVSHTKCDEPVLLWGIPYTFYNFGLSLFMVIYCLYVIKKGR